MKKTALTIIAGFMAICSHAQTAYDALMFSENEYEGTARTIAMGNAFTALGGDLGSIGLNPAGSAVAGYSQVTITPGLTISSSTSQGVSPYTDGSLPYFEKKIKSNMTNLGIPNIGAVLNFETGRTSGLKNFSFGIIANKTGSWNEDIFANGMNNTTTFMGSMAYDATIAGFTGSELNSNNAFDSMPWREVVGYQSGMISTFGGYDDQFVGASEVVYDNGDVALGGPIEQSYGRKVLGDKYDYLFNVGANISDFLYIGASLGITLMEYSYRDYFKEVAVDPADFEIGLTGGETIYFNDMRYRYEYNADGVGYYGKIGVILTPGAGLRIGAAVQTPTINNIREGWMHSGATTYTDSRYDAAIDSPYGEGEYRMVSPYRANFGVAYALGRFGVISADYEVCDYSSMRYKGDGYDRDYFEDVNEQIREYFKASHSLRLGAEIKPISEFAIRAGYGLTTTPETNPEVAQIKTSNVSFGLGYNSKSSFFADLAVRKTFLPDEYFMPYADYMYDADGYIVENGFAPEINVRKNLWKVAITIGWRF